MNAEPQDILELELLHFEELEEEMEILENIMPLQIHDEDYRSDLPELLEEYPEDVAQLMGNFDLMIQILENSKSVEDVDKAVTELNVEVRNCYEGNMKTVFEKTKPYEKSIRALQLLYENAEGSKEVYIIPVKATKFADAANPEHFKAMEQYLRTQFFKFKMDNSPFYISYIGDIGKGAAVKKMASIAELTRCLAFLDIKPCKTVEEVVAYSKKIGLTGIDASLGHVVVPATRGFKNGVKDIQISKNDKGIYERKEQKMIVPLAAAMIGRLMGETPGEYITGLEKKGIIGVDGVTMQYREETNQAGDLDDAGLIMILDDGAIQGSTTANKSGDSDLRKFAKVDVANALLKDIAQFCNNKAFSKWSKENAKAFEKEIMKYLNRQYKRGIIGQGWEIGKIEYDQAEEAVDIEIYIEFHEVADKFTIGISGKMEKLESERR